MGRSAMCIHGHCQGSCRKRGESRPEACRRNDFTPLTITPNAGLVLDASGESPEVECRDLAQTDERVPVIETLAA